MQKTKAKYQLNSNSEFIIENYNFSKPFANFFPGIAGKYGIPMWVFYVNRGQAISSFGTKDKDHAILEFQPANKSWYTVFDLGFRTFIKDLSKKKSQFYEPFHNGIINSQFDLNNRMSITSYDLKIEELNASLGLKTIVEYFTIPEDFYASLVRIVTIKNTSKHPKVIQLLDGLPQVVPFGENNFFLKKMSRTIEAWMTVENLDKGIPYFKLKVDPVDRPQVLHLKEGNYYMGFSYEENKPKLIKPIVDPDSIFGPVTDFSCPWQFLQAKNFTYPKNQLAQNKTPSAFLLLNLKLAPGEEKSFYCLSGNMRSIDLLNSSVGKITAAGYLAKKKTENKVLIEKLQADIDTKSSSKAFNLYVRQTYLDNIMRGGYPVTFDSSVFYLYSRKHGDLERDYNRFQLQPSYFSQGNGNYRDVNQNRRCDVWFNPEIKDENVILFLNLIQADGFNPLVVKGYSFILDDEAKAKNILKDIMSELDITKLAKFLSVPFNPGELIFFLEDNSIKLKVSYDEFLELLIPKSLKVSNAEHGEGFWSDHWTYNLDLLESYLGVYPEKLKEIVFEKKIFTFFDNTEVVKPRKLKYVLLDDLPKQLHSVAADTAKKEMIGKRLIQPHVVRTDYGTGEIYLTTLINKLACLLVNKLSSLDPFGVGIEMESDKPNWFDALNGLPALFGSSLCETFELKRLIIFMQMALKNAGLEKTLLNEEIYSFLGALSKLNVEHFESSDSDKDYIYWDKAYSLKEDYRQKTKFGFSGKETEVFSNELLNMLEKALKKVDQGLAKGQENKSKVYYSYFINEVVKYEHLDGHYIRPTQFKQIPLPLFLEGQMHALRLTNDLKTAKELFKATKNSKLYDKSLKMYKVTDSLKNMPEEIGRCRVFTPGWLENESIWLHMEYKYLLEVIKQGLNEEYYEEFKNVLIPFQKPEKYGRSILENSSFIVSSAFVDKKLHGNGFVARLSGSTAEFLQMWLIMNLGKTPFFQNDKNELNLKFSPKLAGWLFNKKDKTYNFNFLSRILVVYHNPKLKNTFGKNGVVPKKIAFQDKNGEIIQINGGVIPSPYSAQIRDCQIRKIDLYLD